MLKKRTFLASASAKALKQEKPEMDDLERRKNFGSKEKISSFQLIPLQKVQKIFLYILLFQNILSIYLF